MTAGDWQFHHRELLRNFLKFPSIWENYGNLGGVDLISSFDPIKLLYGVISTFTDYSLAERIVYFWPIIIFSYISIITFGKRTFKDNNIGLLFFSLLYLFNTYILSTQTGFVTYAAAYSLVPIAIYFYQRAIDEPKINLKLVISTALTLYLLYVYEARAGVVCWYLIFVIGLFAFIFHKQQKKIVTIDTLLIGLIFSLLALFSAIPLKFLSSTDLPTTQTLFNAYNTIQDTLSFHSYAWQGDFLKPFANTPFMQLPVTAYFYIIPIILFSIGLYLKSYDYEKRWRIICWLCAGLLGVFLLKQQNEPFGRLYYIAFQKVPTFNLYRESNKFILLLIPLCVVFGFAVTSIAGSINIKLLRFAFLSIIAAAILINVKPLINGDIATVFVPRAIPVAYNQSKAVISKAAANQRSLWIPSLSNWSFFDQTHPGVGLNTTESSNWQNILQPSIKDQSSSIQQIHAVSANYFSALLDASNVKYVFLPNSQQNINELPYTIVSKESYISALDNNKNLKKMKLADGSVYYENNNPSGYIFSSNNVYKLSSYNNLADKYDFISSNLSTNFGFTTDANVKAPSVKDLFENTAPEMSKNGKIGVSLPAKDSKIYENVNQGNIVYQIQNGVISVNLESQSSRSGPLNTQDLINTQLDKNSNYVLGSGSQAYALDQRSNSKRDIGQQSANPTLYKQGNNLVSNSTLNMGLWQSKVSDCNKYDGSPNIHMFLGTDTTMKNNYVELSSIRHSACTGPKTLSVNGNSQYLFKFQYRVKQGTQAAYKLDFGKGHASQEEYLSVSGSAWRTYQKVITVPNGANKLDVLLKSLPNEQDPVQGIVDFTDVGFYPLTIVTSSNADIAPKYIDFTDSSNALELNVSSSSTSNLVPNPSFNKNLWQSKVSDCNNHDNDPMIGMKLDKSSKRGSTNSLELSAKTHVACTSSKYFTVQESKRYSFKFDFQSPNSGRAEYSINFNDVNGTSIGDMDIPITNSDWHTYQSNYVAPYGATTANIEVYAYSAPETGASIVNRYDNFSVVAVPSLEGDYYYVQKTKEVGKPNIAYSSISSTKKKITVTNMTSSFYLNLSESYNQGWVLSSGNKHELVDSHFANDGFINGWYIDYQNLCVRDKSCVRNSDGTYTAHFELIFKPQKYFAYGVFVSGITLVSCILFLLLRSLKGTSQNNTKRSTTYKQYSEQDENTK